MNAELSNPSGLCLCGCGQPAPIAKKTDPRRGWVKGQYLRFVHGHNRRLPVDPEGLKECTKCGRRLPATEEFFRRGRNQCKECSAAYNERYYRRVSAEQRALLAAGVLPGVNGPETRQCTQCKRELPATEEFFPLQLGKSVTRRCRECTVAYGKQYREANCHRIRKRNRKHYVLNREEICAGPPSIKRPIRTVTASLRGPAG